MQMSAANIITGIRILCSIALLFYPAYSTGFYVLYIMAGITDMIDGTAARKTNTVSEFGSRLDTAADMVFAAVCLMKLLPVLTLPYWIFIWIGVIAFIKIINIISGFVMQKKFVSVHSTMNKVTGGLLFILPLTITLINLKYSAAAVCSVASLAAIQEGHLIRTGRTVGLEWSDKTKHGKIQGTKD